MSELKNEGFTKLIMSSSASDIPPPIINPKIQFTGIFINNEFVNSISGRMFPTINPSTGEVICNIQEADKLDVDNAVKAARDAFDRFG